MKARLALLCLFVLALPLSGFSQSTLNFPRLFAVADYSQTGFAIVNPAPTAASVTFTLYGASGNTLATSVQPIAARGQISKLGSELFTVNAPGWVQATSPTTGLQGFWLGGDFSNANYLDGAEGAPVGQEFIFPLATATTELNLANLSAASNTLTIRIYGAAGTEPVPAVTLSPLPTNGIFKNTLASIFPSVNFANAMYVKVTGTGNFTGTTLAVDFIHAPSWSVVNGIDTTRTVAEANFPHVPSGPEDGTAKWTSILGITNLAVTAQTVTITYNRSSGNPVTVTRNLAVRGSLRESVKDLFTFGTALEDGWVKVTGTGPIGGFIAYGYSGTSGVAVVPVQQVPQTAMIFSHVANGPSWGTGLALLNATSTDANVEVYIMRRTGALVGGAQNVLTASINLPAGTKTAKLLKELVSTSVDDDGFVYVKSANNVPLYAFELFFTRNNQAIANVAAGAVDPSITFTPPAPAAPLPPLTITSITPSLVPRGNTVAITGTGFSATAANDTVVFSAASGSVAVAPSVATATSMTVTVPPTAITGPVYMTTGGRFSTSVVLQVTADATEPVMSGVTVNPSQTTLADIYVAPGVVPLNANAVGISDTSTTDNVSVGGSSVETPSGVTRRLWITGNGVSSSTIVKISDPTIVVSSSGATLQGYVIVHIAIPAGTPAGPRNITLTNSTLDMSIITGGLIIR